MRYTNIQYGKIGDYYLFMEAFEGKREGELPCVHIHASTDKRYLGVTFFFTETSVVPYFEKVLFPQADIDRIIMFLNAERSEIIGLWKSLFPECKFYPEGKV